VAIVSLCRILVSGFHGHGEVVQCLEEVFEGRSLLGVFPPAVQHDAVQRVRTGGRLWVSEALSQFIHNLLVIHTFTRTYTHISLTCRTASSKVMSGRSIYASISVC